MELPAQVLDQLVDIEATAEEILADKQQLIDLDRRRQKTREAQRALHKDKSDAKQWVCFGNQFIKLPKRSAKKLLNDDFDELEKEMSKLRVGLKTKLNKLRDLENKEDIKGFQLKPLSREEIKSIIDVL